MVFRSRVFVGKMLSQLLLVYHYLPVFAFVVVLAFKTVLEFTFNILMSSRSEGAMWVVPLQVVFMVQVILGLVLALRVFLNLLFDLLPSVEPFPRLRCLMSDVVSIVRLGTVLSDNDRRAIFASPRALLRILHLDPHRRLVGSVHDGSPEPDAEYRLFKPALLREASPGDAGVAAASTAVDSPRFEVLRLRNASRASCSSPPRT